jgi:hypothetical protein
MFLFSVSTDWHVYPLWSHWRRTFDVQTSFVDAGKKNLMRRKHSKLSCHSILYLVSFSVSSISDFLELLYYATEEWSFLLCHGYHWLCCLHNECKLHSLMTMSTCLFISRRRKGGILMFVFDSIKSFLHPLQAYCLLCVISQYRDYKDSERRKRSFQVRILYFRCYTQMEQGLCVSDTWDLISISIFLYFSLLSPIVMTLTLILSLSFYLYGKDEWRWWTWSHPKP